MIRDALLQILFSPTCPQPLPHRRRRADPPWGGRALTSPCRREGRQPSALPQVACFGSSGLETVPTVPGTPRWRAHCSNPIFSLSLHPLPPSDLHDQIIRSIKGLPWQGDDPRKLLQSLNRLQKPRTFIP